MCSHLSHNMFPLLKEISPRENIPPSDRHDSGSNAVWRAQIGSQLNVYEVTKLSLSLLHIR